MSTSEPVIELGDDWTVPEASRPGRRAKRSTRTAVACLALVFAVGLLGGSARSEVPALRLLSLVPRPELLSSGQSIVLADDVIIGRHDRTITAYDLEGKALWSRSYALYDPQYVESTYILLVTEITRRPARVGRDGLGGSLNYLVPSLTTAVDPLTGAQLWEIGAHVRPVGKLLAGEDPQGRLRVYHGNPPTLLWQTEPLKASRVDRDRMTALGLTKDDTLVEYQLATGMVIRSLKVTTPFGDDWLILTILGDRIFLSALGREGLRVFDRESFAAAPWATPASGFADCGAVVCVQRVNGPWSTGAVDRRTGELLWSKPGWELVVTPSGLLGVATRGGRSMTIGLLDPMTGVVRRQLAGWWLAGQPWNETEILVNAHSVRSEIAVLEPGGPRVIGTVPYRLEQCYHEAGTLVCELDNGDLGVWQVNP